MHWVCVRRVHTFAPPFSWNTDESPVLTSDVRRLRLEVSKFGKLVESEAFEAKVIRGLRFSGGMLVRVVVLADWGVGEYILSRARLPQLEDEERLASAGLSTAL